MAFWNIEYHKPLFAYRGVQRLNDPNRSFDCPAIWAGVILCTIFVNKVERWHCSCLLVVVSHGQIDEQIGCIWTLVEKLVAA